jgi:hypothetical protein
MVRRTSGTWNMGTTLFCIVRLTIAYMAATESTPPSHHYAAASEPGCRPPTQYCVV